MKMPSNVLAFAGTQTKVYEMFVDYWHNYQKLNDSTKNVEFQQYRKDENGKDVLITFGEKEEAMNAALRKEIMRVAGVTELASEFPIEQWAAHPSINWATFAVVSVLIDMILPETIIQSIGMYTDVRSIGWGDSAAFDVTPRDLFVVSKSGRGKRVGEMHKQFKGQVVVLPELRELSVQVSLYRVLAGKESLAEFVAKAVRSLETAMTVDVYTVFATAMAALPTTTSYELRFAGYSQENLVKLAQRVTAYNGGAKAVILGTQAALQNVLPADANYRYTLESDYVKIGYIPTAFGYDIMALPQVAAWATPFSLALDDAKIYLVSPSSQKLVKLVLEGSTLSNTTGVYDNANLTQSTTLFKSWGSAIATNSAAGCITL
jgi:hypothetical protein